VNAVPVSSPIDWLIAALLAGLVAALAMVPVSHAEEAPGLRLRQIERELQHSRARERELDAKATKQERALDRLRDQTVAAAQRLGKADEAAERLEGRLAELRAAERAKLAELDSRRAELGETLLALVKLGRQPAAAMMFAPGDAVDVVRSAQLVATAVTAVETRAQSTRFELATLAETRQAVSDRQRELNQAVASLQDERRNLQAAQAETAAAWRQVLAERQDESRRAAELAASAKDLRSLVRKLAEAEREQQPAREAETQARLPDSDNPAGPKAGPKPGQSDGAQALAGLPALARATPARGQLVGRFGDPDDVLGRAKGIRIETRAFSPVMAPADGKVVFAGAFRSYGLLLIIAHDGGYHSLLTGMARSDSVVGQWVLAGEPVGEMGDADAGRPVLYVELRRNGDPVNPLPWIASGERKVSG
jgi:septal ring factor EnvC (AmiA/AmiB activator)